MRILFDSKQLIYKDPFGTLTPKQSCTLHLHIPASVGALRAECILCGEDGSHVHTFPMHFDRQEGAYCIFRGALSLAETGLYFYYFRIFKPDSSFRLFKQGDDTNMEAGDLWQLSCVPEDHTVPDWAKGAVIYQVFPDRFYKSGECDLGGKLTPYVLHENWDEEVFWQSNEKGEILNNDFYGGNFRGITEKLPYIASLGTDILYLNPICKGFSSHRYDTADYLTPDPMLGTMADFSALCDEAHRLGMRVILDGVFSHTGADSLYFDKYRRFGGKGAACDPDSPFRSWYTFHNWPDRYESWWGFETLPTVKKADPAFMDYIISGENSVVAHWLSAGADGFRLDVADELPDSFILALKTRIRQLKPDALLMGEVWEDASNKIAYGIRRRYFADGELDSVMNYPFRTAVLNFLRGADDGRELAHTVMALAENYPPQVLSSCMTLLGSHDTPRLLTALAEDFDGSREQLAARFLTPEQLVRAKALLQAATFLQFTLPGAPSIYYGDEAGMEGGKDPFNRRPYPWGKEDADLTAHFRTLGSLRRSHKALRGGDIRFFRAGDGCVGFTRTGDGVRLHCCVCHGRLSEEMPGETLLRHDGAVSYLLTREVL